MLQLFQNDLYRCFLYGCACVCVDASGCEEQLKFQKNPKVLKMKGIEV